MHINKQTYIVPDYGVTRAEADAITYAYRVHNAGGELTVTLYALAENEGPSIQCYLPEIATEVLHDYMGQRRLNLGDVNWEVRSGAASTDVIFGVLHGSHLYRASVGNINVLTAEDRFKEASNQKDRSLVWRLSDYRRMETPSTPRTALSRSFAEHVNPTTVFFLEDRRRDRLSYIPCVPNNWDALDDGFECLLADAGMLVGAVVPPASARETDLRPTAQNDLDAVVDGLRSKVSISQPFVTGHFLVDANNQPYMVLHVQQKLDVLSTTRALFVPVTFDKKIGTEALQFLRDNLGYGYCNVDARLGVDPAGPDVAHRPS